MPSRRVDERLPSMAGGPGFRRDDDRVIVTAGRRIRMASKYEAEVYHCMDPTLDLLERTENPLHRAILKNYCRHVHLEGASMFEEITAPDMMADDPVYHITWGANPFQVKGRQGVFDFYS